MELDDLKNKWQQYDKVLQQNKMLNEKIIGLMLNSKSANSIRSILHFEYAGLATCILLALYYALHIRTAFENAWMAISYVVSFAMIVVSIVGFFYKHKMLTSLDFSTNNLSTTANTIERFRLFIAKERIYSLVASPAIIASTVVLFAKWIFGYDAENLIDIFLPRIIIGSVVMIAATMLIYKLLYFNSIARIRQNIAEIEKFRSETMP
ncbi:hypothetical protein CAP35_13425 [Chitinophagaceae bacterium IBVUCB1]|jgi:hypothetical protein|nr:hypothetical protein CAP35_13425 [Chitinophagaceae bacterium IBVUCB1]